MDNIMTPRNSYINTEIIDNLIEYEEFFLIKNNNVFKFSIEKTNINNINIRCKNYEIYLNENDLSILTNSLFNNIDEAYEYIINRFENNKVSIKNININKEMKLLISFLNYNNKKNIEITLVYNKENKNLILNDLKNKYKELKNEVNYLKEKFQLLKNEINNLKNNSGAKSINFLNDITNNSNTYTSLDNTFSVFKSIDNILYLIYSNKKKSIISYNLNNNKEIKEIKNAHEQYITNFRYYLDNINRKDLLISVSMHDNNIKLWNINNWECLLNIKNINNKGILNSACFLNNKEKLYILTSNYNYNNSESIKVYDFNGNKISEINDSNDETFFIDTYYNNKLSRNYIITGNEGYIKSYDYNDNNLYHKYYDKDNYGHLSLTINDNDKDIKLIESSCDGYIRIWNFDSGNLLNKLKISNDKLFGICLWDNNYLFVGCKDKTIKLIDIQNNKIISSLIGHNDFVISIKKINHPQYGQCIISQGFDNKIKLWNNIN